nr:ABC transporter ATP-binding protein [Tissierella sp.]
MKKTINKSWGYLILAFLVLLIVSVLDGYITIKIMRIIDSAMSRDMSLFRKESIEAFLFVAALLPASILASYTKGLYILKSLVGGKVTYMERIFNKNINEFQAENNSIYLSSMTNDMNTIEKKYMEGVYEVGGSFISFIVSFIVIAYVSPSALFIGIAISIISTIMSVLVSKPLQKYEKQRAELFGSYTSYIKEVLGAFQIIKSNNLNKKIKEDFTSKSRDIQHKGYLIDRIYTYITASQHFIMNIANISILAIAVYMAIKGSITAGAVILIANTIGRVIYPLMNLSEWMPKIFSVKSIFNRMDEALINHDNYEEKVELESFSHNISFKDVSFSYGEKEILKDIDLDLKKGEKYLIVGPSGGGKSTLLKLLRKYFNPNTGQILIDNKDLKDIKKRSYFHHIANIEQQVFLFQDTLENNLTLYKEYSSSEIASSIKDAGLTDFVSGLEKGLNTLIVDNGKNISGGEKSRIAIARGLLSNSDILFLDEAFASLDEKVAREIERTLLDLKDITVVNVSHIVFKESKGLYNNIFTVKNKRVEKML